MVHGIKNNRRILKKSIAMGLICSLIIFPVNVSASNTNTESCTTKQYVILTQDGSGCDVTTNWMTLNEAEKLKKQRDVLVVEEDTTVQGSSIDNGINNMKYSKKVHEKKVQIRSSKNSDEEWNIQTVVPENVESETVTGPAIKMITKPNHSITTDTYINTNSGSKVKVAIIDSGVDYTRDIDVYERKNFIPEEENVSVIYEDTCGHGTSVAGILAAKDNGEGVTGINPNVELYSAKVLDFDNSAPVSRVVEAIYWAIEKKVNIINISFGTTTDSEALRKAIKDAYNAGILIIAAAGNNGTIEYPAAYEEVMAVGSVNSMGDRSEESATGEDLEIVAPGDLIQSTGDFGGIAVRSGTSMAAPHVVGVASVLWQKDLSCSSNFIRRLLDLSANLYGNSNEYGNGLVDLNYAMQLYDEFRAVYVDEASANSKIEEAKKQGGLADNKNEIIGFQDVDYVKGSWTGNLHEELVQSSNILAIKKGARANDIFYPGMTANPQWHGYINADNYIASFTYLSMMAEDIYTKPSYLSYYDYNNLYDKFVNMDWSYALSVYNIPNYTYNIKMFKYGMAIHAATDIFAHSTFKYVNGQYERIVHDGCDYKDDTGRFDCANTLAISMIYNANNNQISGASDLAFALSSTYTSGSRTFYLGNLEKNIKAISSSLYGNYQYVIDRVNYNIN